MTLMKDALGKTERQYSFWIRPQHENMNSKWVYSWRHVHQSQLDCETFWPNLQLLSLLLLNVMCWWAARTPGYFSHLEFFKSDVNSLGLKTPLVFALSLYDFSEPQISGWPLSGVTLTLTGWWCWATESGEASAGGENDLRVFGLQVREKEIEHFSEASILTIPVDDICRGKRLSSDRVETKHLSLLASY